MKAGRLRLWMTHLKRVPGTSDMGEQDPTFVPVTSFAAGVQPMNARNAGDEYLNTGHMLIRLDRIFDVRYADVKEEDRVQVDGLVYEVLAVAPPMVSGDVWQLKCKSVA